MKLGCRIATLVGLALLAGSPAYAECKLNQIIELPVTMLGTRPTVTLIINGKPARFLVDSGADFSAIDTVAADALGLKGSLINEYVIGVGGKVQMKMTTIKSFALGPGLSLGDVNMLEFPGAGGSGVVGLMGENLLGLADVEYDFGHGALRLFQQEGCAGANLGYWSNGSASELTLTHTGKRPLSRDRDPNHYDPGDTDRHVRAIALVNNQKVNVTFDTGATRSVLTLAAAARAGVTPQTEGATPVGLAGGIGSKRNLEWVAPFDSFALGAEQINHTRLRFSDFTFMGTDMLLGADFFLSHRVFIANSLSQAFVSYVGGPVFRFDDANIAGVGSAPQASAPADASGPQDAEGLIRQAAASSARRDFARAIDDLTRAIALDAKNSDAHLMRGRAREASGQTKAALDDFNEALRLAPGNFEALLARGAWFGRNKDLVKAAVDLEAAARQETPDGRGRMRVAGAYEAFGQYLQAIALYDAILSSTPRAVVAPDALNGRCWARAIQKQELDKALADCNEALRRNPQSASYLDSRALVHVRRGELDVALADYDASIKYQANVPITLYARGVARLQKGMKDAGDTDIKAATALDPKVADQAKRFGIAP